MRVSALLATSAALMLSLISPSRADLLLLPGDRISMNRNCDLTPCFGNSLHYERTWVRDRYLRYDIHTTPARYVKKRVRIMIAPPTVEVISGRHVVGSVGRQVAVELPVGRTRIVHPARYEWVTRAVLVAPEHYSVKRRRPHTAYYPETIAVSEPGESRWWRW
jgi:hypothetical protein